MSKVRKKAKQVLVPRLRFPEFRDAGGWEEKKLGDIVKSENSLLAQNKLSFVSNGYPVYGADGHIGYIDTFIQKDNYIAIIKDGSGVGRLSYYRGESSILGTLTYLKSKQKNSVNLLWLFYLLNTVDFSKYIKGSGIPHIYFTDYSDESVAVPSLPEQQKIADCLSSLDALIAAQAEKLEALKKHKKGLMQQLFPRSGETVPRMRFPEFRDAGGWEMKQLGQVAEFYKGKGISKSDIKADGIQSCVRYGELYTIYGEVIHKVISKTNISPRELFLSRKGDVIIPSSGETKIDIARAACVMLDNVALVGDLNVIRSNHNGVFFSYYLNGSMKHEIAEVAQGDTVAHIYRSNLEKLTLALPKPDEQQKIADCLSSLDALIAAQAEKLQALKKHKKGLMQQLFPVLDEDDHRDLNHDLHGCT